MAFHTHVFLNCPFDLPYQELLKPLLFTIRKIGLQPRIALERFDSGEVRLDKIKELILESQYSIHDLSRIKAGLPNEYYRLNMPFELGIDFGCKHFHPDQQFRTKKFLLLEDQKHSVQKGLSDMSFADCKHHGGNAESMVVAVRNWFVECGLKKVPPASKIWEDYNVFYSGLFLRKKEVGYKQKDIDELPVPEFLQFIDEVL